MSPEGDKVVEVYLRPVGAYSGGNGRIEIHLTYPWVPLIKRDIYYQRVTVANESTQNFVRWVDNETLFIPEKHLEIDDVSLLHIWPHKIMRRGEDTGRSRAETL